MNNQIIKNLKLTNDQISTAVAFIKNGEGLTVVAEVLGLDHLRGCEQDCIIHNLGIFEYANTVAA